jgi:hypothetical protein
MSIGESFKLASPTRPAVRSGIAPLAAVLALGVIVLVLLLSIPTGTPGAHAAGAQGTPHIAR